MNYETRKVETILLVAEFWKFACEHSGDEIYEEVKKLMERTIFSEKEKHLREVNDRLSVLEIEMRLESANKARELERLWLEDMEG